MRARSQYRELLRKYPNVPRYILHDMYRGRDEDWFHGFNRLTWKKHVIEVNINDFSPNTQKKFLNRKFGEVNPQKVYNDKQRMHVQHEITKSIIPGHNEPVILVKRVDGYELWEGFHRAMSLLKLGENGHDSILWNRVKINAWVGQKDQK